MFYADVDTAKADGVIHFWSFHEYINDRFTDHAGGWHGIAHNPNGHNVSAALTDTLLGGLNTAFYGETARDDLIEVTLPSFDDSVTIFPDFTVKFRFKYTTYADPNFSSGKAKLLALGNHSYAGGGANSLTFERALSGGELWTLVTEFGFNQFETVQAGETKDIVIRCIAGTVFTFVDGVKSASSLTTAGLKLYEREGRIGFHSATGLWQHFLNGVISELIIWNRGVSDADITNFYGPVFLGSLPEVIIPAPVVLSETPPIIRPEFQDISPIKVQTYNARLTGDANATTDLELKITSFNGRKRSGRDSYLSVVLSDNGNLEADIITRADGDIVIFVVIAGEETELLRVNYSDVRIDRGPTSKALTLSGTKQTTNADPKTVELVNAIYFRNQLASSSVRFPIMLGVEPADTLTFEGVDYLIDTISYSVAVGQAFMELKT